MRNHRRKYHAPSEVVAVKDSLIAPSAINLDGIGGIGIGQPKLTIDSVREARVRRAEYRKQRAIENSNLDLRSPVKTFSVSDFDCSGRGAGYLCSRSVKNCRMSKGERMEVRLSGTRNPNAQARPTGGVFKGSPDSVRRIERNW